MRTAGAPRAFVLGPGRSAIAVFEKGRKVVAEDVNELLLTLKLGALGGPRWCVAEEMVDGRIVAAWPQGRISPAVTITVRGALASVTGSFGKTSRYVLGCGRITPLRGASVSDDLRSVLHTLHEWRERGLDAFL